jgi:hypothetical protein
MPLVKAQGVQRESRREAGPFNETGMSSEAR